MRTTNILGLLKEGNHEHLDELIQRYRARVEEWARPTLGTKLKRKIELEDVLQEAFTQFAVDVDALCPEDGAGFMALMKRIVLNRIADASDRFMALKRSLDREEEVSSGAWDRLRLAKEQSSGVASKAANQEESRLLRIGICLLDKTPREALQAFMEVGPSSRDIAERLGIKEDAATKRVARATVTLLGVMAQVRAGEFLGAARLTQESS